MSMKKILGQILIASSLIMLITMLYNIEPFSVKWWAIMTFGNFLVSGIIILIEAYMEKK